MKWRAKIMAMFLVVWFITAAGQTFFLEAANGSYASNPDPADGAMIKGDIVSGNISTELIFVPGATAVEHTGYFSDDYSKVESRAQDANLGPPPYGEFMGYEYTFWVGNPQVPPADESLVRGVTYYWCVDETDALGTTYPGDIWEFTVQDYKASAPSPYDGQTSVSTTPILSWKAGFSVEEHDIYLSTSFDDVNDAVYDHYNPPPEFLATRSEPNILVTGLAENTWYYWRVDEVVGRGPPDWIPHEYYKGDVWSFTTVPPVPQTYHVDGVTGDNTNDGLTRETAFKTIQWGINVAEDYDTVLVWPGVYNEEIAFQGKAKTVKSAADAAIVETNYGYAFSFSSAENPDTVLSNFVIRNSQYGIYLVNGASPTLSNLTIVNNDFGISAFNGADPDISNCILWNNYYGDLFRDPVPLEAKYSWVQEEVNEPIAHWKFDEGTGSIAYDSAGNNDGTIYGAKWTTGQLGGALDFDGVNDYVDLSDTVKNYLGTDYTLSAWITTDTLFSNNAILAYRESTSGNAVLFQLDHYNEDIRFTVRDDLLNAAQAVYASILTTNTWYNIACVREGNILNIYVNGVSGTPGSGTIGTISPDNLKIGALQFTGNPPSNHFDGTIDEVAIYNRALSAEEVQRIYQNLADPGFADANNGDYHLFSERGRYWPAHDVWVLDDVTSPCVDGGDPNVAPSNERMPSGGRINMGAYGNTAYASLSEWPIKGDVNSDGRFNFMDIAILLDEWLEELPWAQ